MSENDFPKHNITIYHKVDKTYTRYVVEASVRHTSILNRNRSGASTTDTVLIRIFNIKGYNSTFFVDKDDVIVDMEIKEDIEGTTPYTQIAEKYGRDNVFKVSSIDKFIFDDEDIEDLNHIKLGCK